MWQNDGFVGEKQDISLAMDALRDHIDKLPHRYAAFSPEELNDPPAPGKWSRKQLLGHLVDSALNNLKRFTEIQFSPQPYKIVPYDQNALVVVNHYEDMPIHELLSLWQALNRQIVWVVKKIPGEKLAYEVDPGYAMTGMKTLGWLVADYVAHMEHHFTQL